MPAETLSTDSGSMLINGALIVLSLLLLSCLVSMMAVFLGSQSGDLQAMLTVQALAIPFAIAASLAGFGSFLKTGGFRGGLKALWRGVPGWLLFAFFLLNSLVMVGELSYFLMKQLSAEPAPWREHVPLVCMLACSIAFCTLYSQVATRARATGT